MKFVKSFSAFFLLSGFSNAWAGATFSHEVAVSDTYLRGGLSAVSNSSDTTQYVGCYTNSYDAGAMVVCIGRDAQGVVKSCIDSSPNEATLNAVASISNSSYVYAAFENGTCNRISVHSSSAFIE